MMHPWQKLKFEKFSELQGRTPRRLSLCNPNTIGILIIVKSIKDETDVDETFVGTAQGKVLIVEVRGCLHDS
jgi:hypothetical protein